MFDVVSTSSANERAFRAIVEHDPEPLCLIDEAAQQYYLNPAMQALFKIPETYWAPPQHIRMEFVHPHEQAALRDAGRRSRESRQPVTTDARMLLPHGEWRWFAITVSALQLDGERFVLVRLRDIDSARREQAISREQIAQLQRQNHNASVFLSTISHEFRTPLTAIIGYSEFLTSNAGNPAMVSEDAEVIHREATRLNRLVDDVLLMDRVNNGHMTLHLSMVNLNALVEKVAEAMRPLLARHRLTLDLDAGQPIVHGDQDRLAQAMTNLISNAVKFSDQGGAITVKTACVGPEVILSVHDEGMGIAPEDTARIFERFERVETGAAGRTVGTGLGLAIVSEIARLHEGRVWVESAIGDGSTFSLALPLA
ncbi:MAG: ATP-binding protein [Thermomicrobiales bacterium]